jgi:hypothetical protein
MSKELRLNFARAGEIQAPASSRKSDSLVLSKMVKSMAD